MELYSVWIKLRNELEREFTFIATPKQVRSLEEDLSSDEDILSFGVIPMFGDFNIEDLRTEIATWKLDELD